MRYAFEPESDEFHVGHACRLSKADLTTELVKEFTELQGVVGGLYARAQGEPEDVAIAIHDHYKPASMEDSISRTQTGQLLSIADKLDTLRGCFRVGLIPSGSGERSLRLTTCRAGHRQDPGGRQTAAAYPVFA